MTEQNQTDQNLPASDEQYRGLFEHMAEGFAYCKMCYEAGEPRDFVYLEVNSAFAKLTGLTAVRGKLVSDIIPGIRESNPELFEIYGRVAATGIPEKFETYVAPLGIWFAISVYSPKPEHFVAVFDNITKRKQAEADQLHYTAFLESLNHITRIVLEARDLEEALTALLERIVALFEADNGYLALWDEDQKAPVPVLAYGSMRKKFREISFEAGGHTMAASVMKAGHPIAITDLADSPYVDSKLSALFPDRSMLVMPLIVQDRKLAVLYLGHNEEHSFDQREIDLAEIAAQQIALVLIKVQVLEQAQKQVKRVTLLHEVALISTQVDSTDQLIERVTDLLGANLFPDNFGVLLMDEVKGILRPHPSYRFGAATDRFPVEIPLGQGVTGKVAQTGQPIRMGNVRGVQNYLDVDRGTTSELCVPIQLKGRVLGVINTESAKMDAFSEDDELLLGTLAGQLATAIEQIRAAAAERQWLDQLAHSNELIYALAHITTHIEKVLTPAEIIRTLGTELSKINLTCAMASYEEGRQSFIINYTSLGPEAMEQLENGIGFSLIHQAFSAEKMNLLLNVSKLYQPVVVPNPEEELRMLFAPVPKQELSSVLFAIGFSQQAVLIRLPLRFEEHLLGILWVWGTGITKADLPVMSIFARQIGISLERARLFQEVQSLAVTDPLTGLHNRRSLFELGRIEFSRAVRMGRPFCCMMMDLDNFKQINDNYGHPMGDQVLREFADRCKRQMREIDLLGRYGGEELIVFLPETDPKMAMQVAERLRASIEKTPVKIGDQELKITVSIGVSRKDENTPDLETLIARADQAMYMAKHKGRNRVAISV